MSTLTNADFMATKASHIAWVLAELRKGAHITPMDALKGCGCFRLAAVIHVLRKERGMPILNIWHIDTNTRKRYAKYVLMGA